MFAPALVCGCALGLGTGFWYQDVLPSWAGIVPAEFALVGMAGFLASTIRVPITAIVMVAEISGNHELLMPAMWVCGVAFWLNNGWSLYRSQVHDRESSPIHASRVSSGMDRISGFKKASMDMPFTIRVMARASIVW